MAHQLQSRHYPGLHLQTIVFPDEDHMSAYPAAVSRALRVLYGERQAGSSRDAEK